MQIKKMFQDDINRIINGVVKVDQDADDILVQELDEYIITRELKKHFITFFKNYTESFQNNTADIGVWVSGFFGSGKSHFLKILSYLLENKEVQGVRTIERFRKKFEGDSEIFELICNATKSKTDTILFNIDVEGSINKNNTVILRVFAKMFYNYLGFYGENLKVARLEKFIESEGKTEEFCRVFEEINGAPWLKKRRSFAFIEDDVVATIQRVLGMSKEAAAKWYDSDEPTDMSIAQLVDEIKEYVDTQPQDFHLLFMIDEVGQYIGEDTNLLINLQSLIEKIGSECNGKVWVICTGQEAIDEVIRARENEFSRIQARFKTRLSLSSSSTDEVIQKRILKKTPEATAKLKNVYEQNESVLRNLFVFTSAVQDIKGYNNATEFSKNFPFVPYQFIIMQKVFTEIRKHGNTGKHLSGVERSMLSGFQEAAQKIEDMDEYTLAPFYLFYDTVHSSLDGSIRRVIDRCERAALDGNGLELQDTDILKLLYLIRYVDDIPSNLDNIVVLMANKIQMDKISMRKTVCQSLDRLLRENYIGRVGDTYKFLTDEEQDITKEIKNTSVDISAIIERIANMVYGDIYTAKKYRQGIYDFPFDQMVDGFTVGPSSGGMKLCLLTIATDPIEKDSALLMTKSIGQAIVVLANTPYYEALENSMKIRKYIKQQNVTQLPKSVQEIIRAQQDEATKYELDATVELKKAIEGAEFYVDGEHLDIKGGDAKSKLDQALGYLVSQVYKELSLITKNIDSDADIIAILTGKENFDSKNDPYQDAAAKIEEHLEIQRQLNQKTSVADIQSRYQAIPYGWREIDIAAVIAKLIYDQKVTITYGGMTVQPNNPKLKDMLRKRNEIGNTLISIRQKVPADKMRKVRVFLHEYFEIMDVPKDEDSLVEFIINKFTEQQVHYETLLNKYANNNYPDKGLITKAIVLTKSILSQTKDNIALIEKILNQEDNLYDSKESLQSVENFFKTQVQLFDEAVRFVEDLRVDFNYIKEDEETNEALNRIRYITMIRPEGKFDYKLIPELNNLMQKAKESHNAMLNEKRKELLEVVRQCMEAINTFASDNIQVKDVSKKSDVFYTEKKQELDGAEHLALMDALIPQMTQYKDNTIAKMESLIASPIIQPNTQSGESSNDSEKKENIKSILRQVIFPARILRTATEIDDYIDKIRADMKKQLEGCDGIKVN